MLFSIENGSFSVRHKQLLHNISLDVVPGQVLALTGPNGAGKSTLLKLFSREIIADSGKLTLNRMPLYTVSRSAAARIRAVLPQTSELGFDFNVFEVVEMGRIPYRYKVKAERNKEIIQQSMRLADVSHLENRIYTTLSGGEQQRVHLARVLSQITSDDCVVPRYLLLDEPISALDLEHQHSILALVKQFARDFNVGVLAVLHDLNLASMYADRIAVMEKGRIVQCAEPFSAMSKETIESVFKVDVDISLNPFENCPLISARESRQPIN